MGCSKNYIYRKNPPIHYIVFATPHKKKYLLQKRQLIPLSFLLCKNSAYLHGFIRRVLYCTFVIYQLEYTYAKE